MFRHFLSKHLKSDWVRIYVRADEAGRLLGPVGDVIAADARAMNRLGIPTVTIRTGHHGWLLQSVAVLVAAHRVGEPQQPRESVLDQGERGSGDLDLFLHGDVVEPGVLDAVQRLVAGSLDLGVSVISLVLKQRQDEEFHLVLREIDRALDCPVLDPVQALHIRIPHEARIAARAQRAASQERRDALFARLCPTPSQITY